MKQTMSFKTAIPALALGAVLMFFGPTAAFAQHGGGQARGGHFGGAPHGYAGHGYSAPSYAPRGMAGGGYRMAPGPAYRSGPAPAFRSGPVYRNSPGGYAAGRFYQGRGYYYGGSFWARPYFGVGIGIPYGWGYTSNLGCGFYDGYGYWHPAPCYQGVYAPY